MPVKVWVIPWYREQDWPEWCFICKFKGSHKEWVARAEAEAKVQESLGYNVGQIVSDTAAQGRPGNEGYSRHCPHGKCHERR